MCSEAFEIVEVKRLAFLLASLVFGKYLAKETLQGRQVSDKLLIEGEACLFGQEFELFIVEAAEIGHRGADSFDIVPIVFFALHGDGFAQSGKAGERRIPGFGGAGRLNLTPSCQNIPPGQFEFIFGDRSLVGGENGESVCTDGRIEVGGEVGSKAGGKLFPIPPPFCW